MARMRVQSSVVARVIVIGVLLVLSPAAYAQEATLGGTVTDATGGVLPGVAVTAVHEASGNTFLAVTDGQGVYRIPARVGTYQVTAELVGFATVTRRGVQLLVGQQATVDLQMTPSAVQESVTVTAEAPLVDVSQSRASGNIDPRQMQELPVQGRNWLELTLLAPGSRVNAINNNSPTAAGTGTYQFNIDGQQVTNNIQSSFGQPGFSRDAIAEFEFVTNRFDVSQGRSTGAQVNAITKSGTNTPAGTFSGYFRNDRFNAADHIAGRVLPYSSTQVSTTFGGPILRDKFHFFANYEYEREPRTIIYTTPFPSFNIDQQGSRTQHMGGVRLDFQFSPQIRLAVRGSKWDYADPLDRAGGGSFHPASATIVSRRSNNLIATLTQVLGNRALNEFKTAYNGFIWDQESPVKWANHPQRARGITHGAPSIRLVGFTVGQTHTNTPQTNGTDDLLFRDEFRYSFSGRGRHDLKMGAEFVAVPWFGYACRTCMGIIDAQGGPIPSNLEALFPVWDDVSTWNLAALSPITRRYTIAVPLSRYEPHRKMFAAWFGDDWAVTRRLTLNLGVRYDLISGIFAENEGFEPFLEPNRPLDKNNVAPRVGFAFSATEQTVLRGGFGLYFGDIARTIASGIETWREVKVAALPNDGRPNFTADPFNNPNWTEDDVIRLLCTTEIRPGCLRRDVGGIAGPTNVVPYSYQASTGVQRQLGGTTAVDVDYVYTGGRADLINRNINLSYTPATGGNYPFSDVSRRPYPYWDAVTMAFNEGWSNYHGLQTVFRKRLSNGWQATANYLLSVAKDGTRPPVTEFPIAPDLYNPYGLAADDQRHRAVFNGIWEPGLGFQLSGLYFFGSGERRNNNYGGDRRNVGTGASGRLRPDGTIVPRNSFVGKPIHRIDLRIQRRFAFGSRAAIDGILEVFNVFNRANYGSYVTSESNANYRRPTQNTNVAYAPRTLQLGFRAVF